MTGPPAWGNRVKDLRRKRARLSGFIVRRKLLAVTKPMTQKERAKVARQISEKMKELAALDEKIAKVDSQKTR